MADKITTTWKQNLYNFINNIISQYSDSTTLTIPTTTKITPSDINNLITKLNTLKSNDPYLSTQPTLFISFVSVESGELITNTLKTQFETQISNFEQIKCKNTWTKTNTLKSHTSCSHGLSCDGKTTTCTNCGERYHKTGSTIKSITCPHCHTCGERCDSNGTNSHTHNSHKTGTDILNVHTSN